MFKAQRVERQQRRLRYAEETKVNWFLAFVCWLIDVSIMGAIIFPFVLPSIIKPKSMPFSYQLLFRHILSPVLTNIVCFGFSEYVCYDLVRSQTRFVPSPLQSSKRNDWTTVKISIKSNDVISFDSSIASKDFIFDTLNKIKQTISI